MDFDCEMISVPGSPMYTINDGGSEKWDLRFLKMAKLISTWSKDPSSQIGAVVVGENRRILSTGYNGFPRGIEDNSRLADREEKYKYIVHAEMNAIYNATWNGVSLHGSTIYVYGLPICASCSLGVVQAGVSRAVCAYKPSERWEESFKHTKSVFTEAGVRVKEYDYESV